MEMRKSVLLGGIILIILGLLSFGYTAIVDIYPYSIVLWLVGLILIIIAGYIIGKESKKTK